MIHKVEHDLEYTESNLEYCTFGQLIDAYLDKKARSAGPLRRTIVYISFTFKYRSLKMNK